jgi:hypothetical protein
MIDEELTRKLLGVEPTFYTSVRTKYQYDTHAYVVVRCDVCGRTFGEDGRTRMQNLLLRRKRHGGKDLCATCRLDVRFPLRNFEHAKAVFLECVRKNGNRIPTLPQLSHPLKRAITAHCGGYKAFCARCGLQWTSRR